ncbi:hypothetical protein RUM44_012508 [Polyplax serrata]|uniref:Uncharacterized protein n=1 Tax=Polyplax serrata TaxID=468196 RepID=A0ABR1BBI3_POLSC
MVTEKITETATIILCTPEKNSSVNQQQYLVLETIVEETSDDLCSESDKSGPTGWNSDSDTDSVIHLPKSSENAENWRVHDCSDEVPKKRRRRVVEKISASDDDEPIECNSMSSRSSSLIAFESLEKHCEDVFVGSLHSSGKANETSRWVAVSPDSPRESVDEFDSSDEEHGFSSSVDTLHRSMNAHGRFRSTLPTDPRLRSYRSFDSLNLFENISPISYTLSELSQSHNALDFEKEKQQQQEQEFVIRDKKLTATTADLSRMTDPYETGFKSLGFGPRRRQDVASFHYKESAPYRNNRSPEKEKKKRNHFPSKRKSYSAEALKLQLPRVDVDSKEEIDSDTHGRSEPCLMVQQKSNPSVENLSEDSGFDDHISSKGRKNLVNFRNSVSSIPEDEDGSSPLESSSSNFSDCNGSEEGSLVSTEGREQSKTFNKNVGSSKIAEKQEPEVKGSRGIKSDVEVKFNSDQSQTHIFNCSSEKEGPYTRGEVENLIATPSVPFASLESKESNGLVPLNGSEFQPKSTRKDPDSLKGIESEFESKTFSENELTACTSLHDFPYENMSTKLEKNNGNRLPVLSTPNLLVGVEDLVRGVPSAASSLTHVPLKWYDDDDLDGRIIRNNLLELKNNQLGSGFGGSQNSAGIRGVHFCPVVSEVSWQQDSYSETSSTASSDPSTDEMSNRSLEELCEMQNDEEEYHEVEEKSIPCDREAGFKMQRKLFHGDLAQGSPVLKIKSKSEMNLSKMQGGLNLPCNQWRMNEERNSGNFDTFKEPQRDGTHLNIDGPFSNGCKPCVEEKPVTPTIRVTPTSSGHVFTGDAAQPNAERRIRLSVSESNLPAQGHASEDRFTIDGGTCSDHAAASAKDMTMKKSKSRFGGFFERFSLRRLSNRKSSAGDGKKQSGRKEDKKENNSSGSSSIGTKTGNDRFSEEVMIIPLHGPDNEAEVKEIFRSVVTPHVVSAKPPLPPSFQRMSGSSRKRFPISATVSVGTQDDEGNEKENMPGVRENGVPAEKDCTDCSLGSAPCNVDSKENAHEKPVGLLETDLDTQVTVESAGRRPLVVQGNAGSNKKARSLMNLGMGDMSVHHDRQEALPSGYLEPSVHRSHGSVAVDDRAKSMEFLLDKENQAAVLNLSREESLEGM